MEKREELNAVLGAFSLNEFEQEALEYVLDRLEQGYGD